MTPEQTQVYDFLGELCTALDETDQGHLAIKIAMSAMQYCKGPMTNKELATKIAEDTKYVTAYIMA